MGVGDINLIAKIAPYNDGFRGMVKADQIIDVVATQTGATLNETNTTGFKVYLCDATSASITVNLPTAVGNTARFTFKKIDSSANTVTIDPNASETVDGVATKTISAQYGTLTVVSNGSNWFTIVQPVADAITGGASTIATMDLSTNRALVSDGSGKVATSSVSTTELGYLFGATSNIQTQIDSISGAVDENFLEVMG